MMRGEPVALHWKVRRGGFSCFKVRLQRNGLASRCWNRQNVWGVLALSRKGRVSRMSQIAESLASQFDRLPPHSVESEMCLIASMMLDKEMVGQIVQIIDRDAFFQADHQI